MKFAELVRPPRDRVTAVQVSPYRDGQPGTRAAARLRCDLQDPSVHRHRIVAAHHALLFVTENGLKIAVPERDEGTGQIARGTHERGVVLRQKLIGEIPIRRRERGDAGHAQLVDSRPCRVRLSRSLRPRAWGE